MEVKIHFLYGNDLATQSHYQQKEYRDDIVIEIDDLFYEVYFFVKWAIEYEMRKDGFFTFPGIIILEEITNDNIYNAIDELINYKYFDYFVGKDKFPLNDRFINSWYSNDLSLREPHTECFYKLRFKVQVRTNLN